jgi:predicted ATPase/DNA-binding SARP family transcriptional activator
LEFALLGPLEVRRLDDVVPVRHGRPRVVLLALLVSGPRAVPSDVLIECTWGDDAPADPVNALQVLISYLRKALALPADGAAPALRTVSGGYRLDVADDLVDARRFEQGVDAVDDLLARRTPDGDEAALERIRSVLALWRGEPLQDVMYQPFFAPEVARLYELEATAQEHQAEALLRLGHHDQVVAVTGPLIATHPLRERFRVQQIVALARSGRQAEALRAYDVAREELVEELGIEPGAELQDVHRMVLEQDAAVGSGSARTGAAATSSPTPPLPRLPATTSRLVGRQEAIAEVDALLQANRVVTLTGPGGAGKTRLALAVAHDQGANRPVWLVELAQVRDPADVASEVATAVGVTSLSDPVEALASRLADEPGLLLLDTCEHVVDACAELTTRLLRRCPGVGVLATSRQALDIDGEVAWSVPPLGAPAAGAPLEEIRASAAVQLFTERARSVRNGFVVDDTNADAVAAVCRMLDGLPLAIELAAARAKVLSVAAILERLDDRFSLLTARSTADPRRPSLRATIEWSHDLLDDDQRTYFARLGVFAGRFTYAAADAVAAHDLEAHPLDLLTAMVDRSLVVTDGDDSYRMLDSLRAFAAEQLAADADEQHDAPARLTQWLAARCSRAEERVRSAGQAEAVAELRAEMPNLRAALEWSLGGGDLALGVDLAAELSWFWALEGASTEASRWLGRALAVTDATTEGATSVRARLLEASGIHALVLGDLATGDRVLRQAVAGWQASGEAERGALSLTYVGVAERWQGRVDEAAATQDEAIELARRAEDDWVLAWSLVWRAQTAMDQSRLQDAAAVLGEARDLATRLGDRRVLARVVHELGCVALLAGDADRALDLGTNALAAHPTTPNAGLAAADAAVGRALVALGRAEEAIDHHRRALRTATELGHAFLTREALEGGGVALAAAGRTKAAAEVLGSAAALRERAGFDVGATLGGRAAEELAGRLRDELGPDEFEDAFHDGERRAPRELVGVLA